MNTFTKTLIASAMAVAVAGPASADPKFTGVYAGSSTTLSVQPSGCPNANLRRQTTAIGFAPGFLDWVEGGDLFEVNIPFAGCWTMTGLGALLDEEFDMAHGTYIERRPGRDLTMAVTLSTLEDIVDVMNAHLVTESKCDVSLPGLDLGKGVDPLSLELRRGQGTLSKNGERVNVNLQISGTYDSSERSDRNITARINGRMDFNPTGLDPIINCNDAIVDFIGPVL